MIYRFIDEYHFLSNFYLVTIHNNYDNFEYPSVEHAYQAMKSDLIEWKEFCRSSEIPPGIVKVKSKSLILPKNWEEEKLEYMTSFIKFKFYFNSDLKNRLQATGNQNLIEGNYHGDSFWGVDLKVNPNIGENHLGRIIMEIRNNL